MKKWLAQDHGMQIQFKFQNNQAKAKFNFSEIKLGCKACMPRYLLSFICFGPFDFLCAFMADNKAISKVSTFLFQ